MRRLTLALIVLILPACGPKTPASTATTGSTGTVQLSGVSELPDWLLVAHQRDCERRDCVGDLFFNQRAITRNADGTADIWIQVRHGEPQHYPIETATARTIIEFTFERLHYRFRCADGQFIVLERQIMGAHDVVVAHDEPPQIYRAPVDGSVTPIIQPIACRGG